MEPFPECSAEVLFFFWSKRIRILRLLQDWRGKLDGEGKGDGEPTEEI